MSNLSIYVDGSTSSLNRVIGTYLGSFVLRKNESTLITAGVAITSNLNSLLPILPTFSYMHTFGNGQWTVDIALPKYAYLRRKISSDGSFSIGTSI